MIAVRHVLIIKIEPHCQIIWTDATFVRKTYMPAHPSNEPNTQHHFLVGDFTDSLPALFSLFLTNVLLIKHCKKKKKHELFVGFLVFKN